MELYRRKKAAIASVICIAFIAIFLFALPLSPARADVADIGVSALKCTVINGLARALEYIAIAYKLGLLAGGPFSFSALTGISKTAELAQIGKQAIFDVYARCIARAILDDAIAGILDTIRNGGRDGGPSYVRNWRSFQTQATYRGEGIFRGILANTPVCDFLRSQIDQTFRVTAKSKISLKGINIRVGSLDPFTLQGKCTLPDGFDIAAYQKDFAGNGGWDALMRLAEPQNNPYGLALMAADELAKQRTAELSADTAETTSNGYLSSRGSASCKQRDENGKCLQYSDIRTPGSLLSGAAISTIKSEIDWFTNVHTWEDLIIGVITNRLIARLTALDSQEGDQQYYNDFPTPRPTAPYDVCTVDPTNPLCVPTPTPTPTSTPTTTATACQTDIASGTPGPFDNDIKNAITQIKNESLTASNPILNTNDTQGQFFIRINDLALYFQRMTEILKALGYSGSLSGTSPATALWLYKTGSGAQTTEEYTIASATPTYTRDNWSASSCPLPSSGGGGNSNNPPAF